MAIELAKKIIYPVLYGLMHSANLSLPRSYVVASFLCKLYSDQVNSIYARNANTLVEDYVAVTL